MSNEVNIFPDEIGLYQQFFEGARKTGFSKRLREKS